MRTCGVVVACLLAGSIARADEPQRVVETRNPKDAGRVARAGGTSNATIELAYNVAEWQMVSFNVQPPQ